MWARFTERARRTVFFAQEEAAGRGENSVSTEHFLLGLTRETDHVAAKLLERLRIALPDIRAKVEANLKSGAKPATGQDMQLSPRAKKVIDLAYDEAQRLDNNYIGTEHLLLGLLREDGGLAGRVLCDMGAQLSTARAVLQQMQSEGREGESKPPDRSTPGPTAPPADTPSDRPQPGDLGVLRDHAGPDRTSLEIAVSSEALLLLRNAMALKDHHEYRDLFAQNKFVMVEANTPLKLLRLDTGYFVRQIGGSHDGETGWILPQHFEGSGPDTRPFPPPVGNGSSGDTTAANLPLTLPALLGTVPHEAGAELCLVSGLPPLIRTRNGVVPMTSELAAAVLDEAAVRALLQTIMDDAQREMLQANRVMHFSYQLPNNGPRFQIHIYPQPGRTSAMCAFDGPTKGGE